MGAINGSALSEPTKILVHSISDFMGAEGFSRVEAEYCGEGDNGMIEAIHAWDTSGVHVGGYNSSPLHQKIFDLLDALFPGFEEGPAMSCGAIEVQRTQEGKRQSNFSMKAEQGKQIPMWRSVSPYNPTDSQNSISDI